MPRNKTLSKFYLPVQIVPNLIIFFWRKFVFRSRWQMYLKWHIWIHKNILTQCVSIFSDTVMAWYPHLHDMWNLSSYTIVIFHFDENGIKWHFKDLWWYKTSQIYCSCWSVQFKITCWIKKSYYDIQRKYM